MRSGIGNSASDPFYVAISTATTDPNGNALTPSAIKAASYTQLGYQQLLSAGLSSSTALTVPSGATTAIIQNNGTQAVRWRPDGATTAPTSTTGQRIAAGSTLTLDIGNAGLTSSRFIREADGSILDITYYS